MTVPNNGEVQWMVKFLLSANAIQNFEIEKKKLKCLTSLFPQNNLNYAVCIKRQWDTCSIMYSNEVDDVEYDFQLINVDAGKWFRIEECVSKSILSCPQNKISQCQLSNVKFIKKKTFLIYNFKT